VGCYAEKKEEPLDNDKTLLNSGSEKCITQKTQTFGAQAKKSLQKSGTQLNSGTQKKAEVVVVGDSGESGDSGGPHHTARGRHPSGPAILNR
jgi:hypothetical protein